MNFRVGQKVVRINSQGSGCAVYTGNRDLINCPPIGVVCTVKTINHWARGTLITLVEYDNSHLTPPHASREPGFNAAAFRPAVEPKEERKTDISIFLKMLGKAPEHVEQSS